jgi:hypothetical protein
MFFGLFCKKTSKIKNRSSYIKKTDWRAPQNTLIRPLPVRPWKNPDWGEVTPQYQKILKILIQTIFPNNREFLPPPHG